VKEQKGEGGWVSLSVSFGEGTKRGGDGLQRRWGWVSLSVSFGEGMKRGGDVLRRRREWGHSLGLICSETKSSKNEREENLTLTE
jgi:hypothetical protein